jgi:hypothetical protein
MGGWEGCWANQGGVVLTYAMKMVIITSAAEIQYASQSPQAFKGPDEVTGEWKNWQEHLASCPLPD